MIRISDGKQIFAIHMNKTVSVNKTNVTYYKYSNNNFMEIKGRDKIRL